MLEPKVQELLDRGPTDVDRAEWRALSSGDRLRILKNAHHLFTLTREQRDAVERLPVWTAYGPSDGLPADWFGPEGLLLPKYRPGGGLYPQFQLWRRWHRRVAWSLRAGDRRLERFDSSHGGMLLVLLMMGLMIGWLFLLPPLRRALPGVPEGILELAPGILTLLTVALLPWLGTRLYSRCVRRAIVRRFPLPEDLERESS